LRLFLFSRVWSVFPLHRTNTKTEKNVFQIHLKEGNYRMADQSLEVGLSYNFQVSIFVSSVSYVPEWVGFHFPFFLRFIVPFLSFVPHVLVTKSLRE
jgi:hypothetical protein